MLACVLRRRSDEASTHEKGCRDCEESERLGAERVSGEM